MQLARRDVLTQLALALAIPAAAVAKSRPVEGRSIEGHWACRTNTRLERPKGLTSLWVSKAEADAYLKTRAAGPPPGADPVGQATTEWDERGPLTEVDGRFMSSFIIDPPDGKLPYSEAGLKAMKALDKRFEEGFDNPEIRDPAERCLGGTVGPPMIDVGYGAHLRITCTADHVAIQSEEGFQPRIIPLKASPGTFQAPSWTGVSLGRFEGAELVVETTNFHPQFLMRWDGFYLSPQARITERFTPSGTDGLRYVFAIDDPSVYTQTWRAMMIFKASDARMFEFACHEGNYALVNILGGARETEKAKAMKAPTAASPP
jgi:hypothetical protein